MSAWDRARYIPWTHIPQDGKNLDAEKERIYRQLQRTTQQDELTMQQRNPVIPKVESGEPESKDAAAEKNKIIKVPYSNMELFRQAAFGSTIGAITGCVFGFMDGMRTAGQSATLQKASNNAKLKYLMQGTTRAGAVFGTYFGGYHVLKYGLRVVADPGEAGEIIVAGACSMGALMSQPAYRPFMPYGSMLIIMDIAHIVMREMDKE